MKYAFIAGHRHEYPLAVLCSTLGVSRSGFYDWLTRAASPRRREDRRLRTQIKMLFQKFRRAYGSPRIRAELQARDVCCSRKRVARLMRAAGLQARPRRRFQRTTVSDASHPVAPNLLGRNFSTATPNAVWLADITYLRTRDGWLYLAAILDLGSRRIVGWALDSQMTQELTLRALRMALEQRQPPRGMIHHSDRGSQYTCTEYRRLLWWIIPRGG